MDAENLLVDREDAENFSEFKKAISVNNISLDIFANCLSGKLKGTVEATISIFARLSKVNKIMYGEKLNLRQKYFLRNPSSG